MEPTPNFDILPRHIGIIMDGNGRWAKKRGLNRFEGHKQGAKVFKTISDYALQLGIECVTFYAFSTENWKRPETEVNAIMDLFREYLFEAEEPQYKEKNARLHFIGSRDGVPEDIVQLMKNVEEDTKNNTGTIVNIAINYGGRDEILKSVKAIAKKVENGEIKADDITNDDITSNLYPSSSLDADLIIRPSGEYRLSNFLLWQSAYSEFWFADVLWPDFTIEDFNRALNDYANRNRRFGGV
ncbi:MAG: isoprenyl transferase [Clostridiales bacterium]|nr:isoprenyl transferase [Clostridiales bacterium]